MSDKPKVEDLLLKDLQENYPADWTREVQPFAERKWRIDVASPKFKIAAEIHGSFHVSQGQMRKDAEKSNALTCAGWRVLFFPASCVLTIKRRQRIVEQIGRLLCGAVDTESDVVVLTGD